MKLNRAISPTVIKLTKSPSLSVVIRTREEEKYLRALLSILREQSISNFEVVLVVDYANLSTLRVMRRLPVDEVIGIDHGEFNHAYSTNLGVAACRADLVAITNGHSLPVSARWLEAGVRHFVDPSVAGVTGLSTPASDGSIWEKLYFTPVSIQAYKSNWLRNFLETFNYYIFSTTNCIIRKSLWNDYPFDESLPQCEDYDWGREMHARGYSTIIDPEFSVFHSHGDALAELYSRRREWEKVTRSIDNRTRPRSSLTRLATTATSRRPKLRTAS